MAVFSERKQLAFRMIDTVNSTVVYTCPTTSTFTIVNVVNVTNVDANSSTFNMYVVQSNVSAATQFAVMLNKTVATNTTDLTQFQENTGFIVRGNNAKIVFVASRAKALTVALFGVETSEV